MLFYEAFFVVVSVLLYAFELVVNSLKQRKEYIYALLPSDATERPGNFRDNAVATEDGIMICGSGTLAYSAKNVSH